MRERVCIRDFDCGEACWRSAILMVLFGIVMRPYACNW